MRVSLDEQHDLSVGLPKRFYAQSSVRDGSGFFGTGRAGQDCVIVATSALELGIDVGDLDLVLQIDAPSSVASFCSAWAGATTDNRPTSSCTSHATNA